MRASGFDADAYERLKRRTTRPADGDDRGPNRGLTASETRVLIDACADPDRNSTSIDKALSRPNAARDGATDARVSWICVALLLYALRRPPSLEETDMNFHLVSCFNRHRRPDSCRRDS
jgi:hypothetical protein